MIDQLLITKDQLDEYPKLNPATTESKLIAAIRDRKLVVFYGAGVSMLGGAPSWRELAGQLLEKLGPAFLPAQHAALGRLIETDPRKAITICRLRAKKEKLDDNYFDALHSALAPPNSREKREKFCRIHTMLRHLYARAYLTTNIDQGMEQLDPGSIRPSDIIDCTNRDVDVNDLTNGNIFYLHGCLRNIRNATFTVDQYAEHYRAGSRIIPLLKEAFSAELTVLFIGYSLADHEIIQNILWAVNPIGSSESEPCISHYLLRGITVEEYAQFTLESDYFASMSIRSLPYFIDYDSHDRLLAVMERLHKLVQDEQHDTFTEKRLIDDL